MLRKWNSNNQFYSKARVPFPDRVSHPERDLTGHQWNNGSSGSRRWNYGSKPGQWNCRSNGTRWDYSSSRNRWDYGSNRGRWDYRLNQSCWDCGFNRDHGDYRSNQGCCDYESSQGRWDYRSNRGHWDYGSNRERWDHGLNGGLHWKKGSNRGQRGSSSPIPEKWNISMNLKDVRSIALQNRRMIDNISSEMRCREILIGGTDVNFSDVKPCDLVPKVIQFVKEKLDVQMQKEDIEKIFVNQTSITIVFVSRIFGSPFSKLANNTEHENNSSLFIAVKQDHTRKKIARICDFAKRGEGILDSFVNKEGVTAVMTLDGNYTKVNTVKQARKYMTDKAVSIQNEEIREAKRKESIQSGQEKRHQTYSSNVLKTQSAVSGSAKEPRIDGNICQQKLDEIQQPQVVGGIKCPLHGAGDHRIQQAWFGGGDQPPCVCGIQQVVIGGAVQHPAVVNLFQHPPVVNLIQHPTMANLIQHPTPASLFQHPPMANLIQQPPPVLSGIQQPQMANGIQQSPAPKDSGSYSR